MNKKLSAIKELEKMGLFLEELILENQSFSNLEKRLFLKELPSLSTEKKEKLAKIFLKGEIRKKEIFLRFEREANRIYKKIIDEISSLKKKNLKNKINNLI